MLETARGEETEQQNISSKIYEKITKKISYDIHFF